MITKTKEWIGMDREAYEYDEHNDCSVVALAIAAGWDYIDAHGAMWKAGRRRHKGATIRQSIQALEQAKVKHTVLDTNIMERMTKQAGLKTMTVNQFAKINNMKGTSYQIMIRGHIFAMIDGVVHDFENSGKHRVLCAIELFNKPVITTDQLIETIAPLPQVTFKEQRELYV